MGISCGTYYEKTDEEVEMADETNSAKEVLIAEESKEVNVIKETDIAGGFEIVEEVKTVETTEDVGMVKLDYEVSENIIETTNNAVDKTIAEDTDNDNKDISCPVVFKKKGLRVSQSELTYIVQALREGNAVLEKAEKDSKSDMCLYTYSCDNTMFTMLPIDKDFDYNKAFSCRCSGSRGKTIIVTFEAK